MARYVMRVRTEKSAEEAFAFMADLRNFPEWDPGTTSAVQVKGDGPGNGAEYDLQASGATLRYVVQAFDRPDRVVARARNRWITSVDTITVSSDGTGSVVSYDADLALNGFLRFADPVLKLAFNRIGGQAADGLVKSLKGTRLR